MPYTADDLDASEFLKILLLGYPKTGKSTTALITCEKPVYVINCDQKSSLTPAKRRGIKFDWDLVRSISDLDRALLYAEKSVNAGKYKTVMLDTITNMSRRMKLELENRTKNARGESDGRRFWEPLGSKILETADRLVDLDCHVIATGHYSETSGEIDGQLKKSGEGVVPLIPGSARMQLSGIFDDVVFFEKRGDKREFTLKTGGKFGPGGRSLDDVDAVDADIQGLWRLFQEANAKKPAVQVAGRRNK